MFSRFSSARTQRLTEVKESLEKIYEADNLPPHLRRLLEQLDSRPPKKPAKPH
jgi:hypothetical protein